MLRIYVETGVLRYQRWAETGGWPEVGPPATSQLVAAMVKHVPSGFYKLTPDERAKQEAYETANKGDSHLIAELRRPDVVFRDRQGLIDGINEGSPSSAEKIGGVPGAADGGLEWWALAVAATGALWLLGRMSWQGALISAVAARIFASAVVYMGLTTKTPEGKNLVWETAKELAKDTYNALPDLGVQQGARTLVGGLVAIGLVAAGAFAAVKIAQAASKGKKRRHYLEDEDEDDAGDEPRALEGEPQRIDMEELRRMLREEAQEEAAP